MAGTEHKWRAEHASAVEKALAGAPASLATVVAAAKAVRSDVKPGKMADADFLMSAAEGLLFEALVTTLGLVSPALHFASHLFQVHKAGFCQRPLIFYRQCLLPCANKRTAL